MAERFTKPLSAGRKASAPITRGTEQALAEMAGVRGLTRSELIRRILAAAIVADAPAVLAKMGQGERDDIESLAHLWGEL